MVLLVSLAAIFWDVELGGMLHDIPKTAAKETMVLWASIFCTCIKHFNYPVVIYHTFIC